MHYNATRVEPPMAEGEASKGDGLLLVLLATREVHESAVVAGVGEVHLPASGERREVL